MSSCRVPRRSPEPIAPRRWVSVATEGAVAVVGVAEDGAEIAVAVVVAVVEAIAVAVAVADGGATPDRGRI